VEQPAAPKNVDAMTLSRERPALLRFALLQVRQKHVAEDLVQDTLVAALAAIDGYSGRSSVRTWLTAILRNKTADHFRAAGREVSLTGDSEDDDDEIDRHFVADGHYRNAPMEWGDPERTLTEKRFLQALQACVNSLPYTTAQAFLLREVTGLTTEEICKELKISSTNCFVLLHRARLRLRACVEATWLQSGGVSAPVKAR
jgi:RNA polymerase sigma-70 factor, ECF subfamily